MEAIAFVAFKKYRACYYFYVNTQITWFQFVFIFFVVNSVQWAPQEFGLVLACASSDGSVSVLTYTDGKWESQKLKDAHAVSKHRPNGSHNWY